MIWDNVILMLRYCDAPTYLYDEQAVARLFECLTDTLGLKQNGSHSADNEFKYIFLNEILRSLIQIPLRFNSKGPINTTSSLAQVMTWHHIVAEPYFSQWWPNLLTYIYIYIYMSSGLNVVTCVALYVFLGNFKIHFYFYHLPTMTWRSSRNPSLCKTRTHLLASLCVAKL